MDNYWIQIGKFLWNAIKKFKFKKKVSKTEEFPCLKRASLSILDTYKRLDPIIKYDDSLDRVDLYKSGTEVIKVPHNIYGSMIQEEIEDFFEKEICRIGHILFKKE